MIKLNNISKKYGNQIVLDGFSHTFGNHGITCLLGASGSGKSTLLSLLAGFDQEYKGKIIVNGQELSKLSKEALCEYRRNTIGFVFQEYHLLTGYTVLENILLSAELVDKDKEKNREWALMMLRRLNLEEKANEKIENLSGGQKQRVAIAGVMAMHPKCIVLDEPTAMLDPNGRKEVLKAVRELNKKEGVTVILITHYMEEVVFADDVYVMDRGHIVMHGVPKEIFSRVDQLKKYRLDVPQVTLLAYDLKEAGLAIPDGILTIPELVDALSRPEIRVPKGWKLPEHTPKKEKTELPQGKESIKLEHVGYTYNPGSAYEMHALKDVNLEIPQGQFVGIIGHTGSGKSTLIQHFNGLIRPTEGHIYFEGQDIWADKFPLRGLRSQVGLVFQYPEHQLFETDVLTDVCFGPKNQNLPPEECEKRAKEALEHVGLDESYYAKSPFELSGGQKRRVAIAGVLAMNPKVLILDEPTAGLDPMGRDEILDQIASLHETRGITIILVSHSMEDIAKYVERIIVMNHGVKTFDDAPKKVFAHYKELEAIGLAAPQITYIMHALKEKGLDVDTSAINVDEATTSILRALWKKEEDHK